MNRSLIACAVAGLALRLAFALFYWTGQPLSHDEREYLALARGLLQGSGFAYPADEPPPGTAQRFGRAPGYPVFLAALGVREPQTTTPARVKIAQAALGAIGVWLIGIIAARAAGPRAGAVAAAIAAVYPPLVWMPAYALSETLYSTIALAAAALLDRVGDRRDLPPDRLRQGYGESANALRAKAEGGSHQISAGSGRRALSDARGAALAGVLLGIGMLVRPAMVFALPLIAGWLAWPAQGPRTSDLAPRTSHLGPRAATAGLAAAAVVVAVAFACVLPWTLRNARVYHRMVFVASEGGVTFWTGNHPLSRGEGDLAANPDLKRAELAFREAHPGLAAEQLEPLYYRDALRRIADDPIWWLGLLARKAFYTVVPIGPSYTLHSAKYFAASAASYAALLPFAIAGAWRLRRAPRRPAALWLMAVATVAANLLFLPQERFRIPVIDPALIVTAAALGGAVNAAHGRAGRHSDV